MKKILFPLIITTLLVVLFGCDVDHYKGKRPFDYSESVWICTEYQMTCSYKTSGVKETWQLNGEELNFYFLWSSIDSRVSFMIQDEDGKEKMLFGGRCTFGKKRFIVIVGSIADDCLLDINDGDELVFERIE